MIRFRYPEHVFRVLQLFPSDVRERLRDIEFDTNGRNTETCMCPLAYALNFIGISPDETGSLAPSSGVIVHELKQRNPELHYREAREACDDFINFYAHGDWKSCL